MEWSWAHTAGCCLGRYAADELKAADARWLITNLDDRPMFVSASEHFTEGTTENVIWLLDQAIHEYAKPREILTDRESQHGPLGPSALGYNLVELLHDDWFQGRIRHVFSEYPVEFVSGSLNRIF